VILLVFPASGLAANNPPVPMPVWSAAPFVLLLLAIAVLPLVAEHFWERNRNKALVTTLFALPVAAYLWYRGPNALALLHHELQQYSSFIILLAALYTVSGGIILRGDLEGKPTTNALFLAIGAILANVIGTTGASMLLIRPVLRINHQRQRRAHIPVFFIFMVSNLGGLLTPLGDPPLFLGFLNGVEFFWTMRLWPQWLLANGLVLGVFLVWDLIAHAREPSPALLRDRTETQPLRFGGRFNMIFLIGILVAAVMQAQPIADGLQAFLNRFFACPPLKLEYPVPEGVMAGMAFFSWLLTPRALRKENQFTWHPILEVAILFAGIFVAMVPALEVLKANSASLHLTEPWHYFWTTGSLSSFLDNAPTYMVFTTLAANGGDFSALTANRVAGLDGPLALAAISCGAVFMGANTYIGNGPNFMVKAIADRAGCRMPSFFGYMLYALVILVPIWIVVTYVFFWK
jgi:Na+/H+ antiporter NhaD/arsenite permease-like protein